MYVMLHSVIYKPPHVIFQRELETPIMKPYSLDSLKYKILVQEFDSIKMTWHYALRMK